MGATLTLFDLAGAVALLIWGVHMVGARRWIARVMVSWGLVSAGFAFINGPTSFFILRFLLGLAEAGFFPGMILYFTYWFPPSHRCRITAGFMAAIPVSIGLGAPISTALLDRSFYC